MRYSKVYSITNKNNIKIDIIFGIVYVLVKIVDFYYYIKKKFIKE